MKRTLGFFGLLFFSGITLAVIPGDVNNDGKLSVADAPTFVDYVYNRKYNADADMNGDGKDNKADLVPFVQALVEAELAAAIPVEPPPVDPPPVEPPPTISGFQMGMNLSPVTDWNREWVFVNAINHARGWIPCDSNGTWTGSADTAPVDADGWPTGLAATLMFREIDGHYPPGKYVCTFAGDGDLKFSFATATRIDANRYELNVTPSNAGIIMAVVRNNSANPVRNIKVWMPGMESAESPFHPLFRERLDPFRVLRFMDWQHTNGSSLVAWAGRAKTTDARQSTNKGVAYEYIIELCNQQDADPWICVPHQADDDYIRQMAALFKLYLELDRKVYVEYSNEIWNSGFAVNKYLGDLPGTWLEAVGSRETTTFRIWGEVWAGQTPRLVRVVAGQKNNLWMTGEIVKAVVAAGGQFEAISCSGYIGPGKSYTTNVTPAQIIADTNAYTANDNLTKQIKGHADLAKQYGKRFVVYEGGQHISLDGVIGDKPYVASYYAVQVDPGMAGAYKLMLDGFKSYGGDLFCAYNYVGPRESKYGSWGHLEYQDQDTAAVPAPKWQALLDSLE